MKQLTILLLILLIFTSCKNQPGKAISENEISDSKPNIVFLLADDLGYGELGCYGQKIIKTPVLDSLASNGIQFTDFYAGNAACSPSRAVLQTGKSSSFNTIRGNSGSFNDHMWLRVALKKNEKTLGELLQDNGYQTGYFGKWHLEDPNDFFTWAHNRGYDYVVQEQWASRLGGKYFTPKHEWVNGKRDSIFYDADKWNCMDEWRTTIAFDYLDKIDKTKPFMLFMSYRAPHASENYIGNKELYADKGWKEVERRHAAKITLLDKEIGKMINKLEIMGELDNTLIIFTSDNGPHREGGHNHEFFNSNGKLRGHKRDVYEGGIRVPFIMNWNGRIDKGRVSEHIAGFQDIVPTIAEIVGTEIPEQSNGISFLPLLMGEKQTKHEYMAWEFQLDGWWQAMPKGGFRQSVRMGQWKGVRYGAGAETELYNLGDDISESNNLASKYPELVTKMSKMFKENRTDTDGFPYGGVIQEQSASSKRKK